MKEEVKSKVEDEWKARSDFDALLTAEEIKADNARYRAALKVGEPKVKAIRNLSELKKKASSRIEELSNEESKPKKKKGPKDTEVDYDPEFEDDTEESSS